MTRQSNREPNDPVESSGREGSAWQEVRAAITSRSAGSVAGDRSMDERTGNTERADGDRTSLGAGSAGDGTPAESAEQRPAPSASRFVVSVDGDGTAESRLLSDGGASPPARGRYTVDVTAKTDHGVASHAVASNDVSETFEELLRWYASRVAPDDDPAEVVEVLLAASDFGRG
jgi:hypothetical protein